MPGNVSFHVSQVDRIRRRCYARFEDDKRHWCEFADIQNRGKTVKLFIDKNHSLMLLLSGMYDKCMRIATMLTWLTVIKYCF